MHESEPRGDEPPRVTVVVCTHNGAKSLPTVLAALNAQQLVPGEKEVVVVADHCEDDSEEVAAAYGARVVPVLGQGGLAAARNTGVASARGEIIAFTDDDCEPEPAWLKELIQPFADASIDGVGGRTVPASEQGLVFGYIAARNPLAPLPALLLQSRSPIFRLRNYIRSGQGPSQELAAGALLYSVAGANMAFRRDLVDALDGFDSRIQFGGEEEDLCRRAHNSGRGARFVYQPSALVRHHYREGLGDTLRRARAYGRGNARAAMGSREVSPIIYPFPLLWLAVTTWLLRSEVRRAALGMMLPPLLYSRWLFYATGEGKLRALVFPYLQMAQEAATMTGEVQQWLAARGS